MVEDMLWYGKKIFVKLKNSNRSYSGIVLNENDLSITIKDIYGHLVDISKSEIAFRQEEK